MHDTPRRNTAGASLILGGLDDDVAVSFNGSAMSWFTRFFGPRSVDTAPHIFVLAEAQLRTPGLQRGPRGSVVFLDIDGVLHRYQSGALDRLDLFESWLREHNDIDVVISSNWRVTHTQQQLLDLFSPDLRWRVIGVTPVLPERDRYEEISAVVRRYAIRTWAALDDDESLFARKGNLVLTDPATALTTENLQSVERLLGIGGQ